MSINIAPGPKPEKKKAKKLTIEIIDKEALFAVYPQLKIEVVVTKVDRHKLLPIVKSLRQVGMEVPGVTAYYASEGELVVAEGDIAKAE